MREAVLPCSPVELDPLDPSESFVDSCAAGFSADLAESSVASCAAASGFCGAEMDHKAHFSISRQQARGHWPLVATSRHHAQFGHLFRMVPQSPPLRTLSLPRLKVAVLQSALPFCQHLKVIMVPMV